LIEILCKLTLELNQHNMLITLFNKDFQSNFS
jgi:hypothetical protein